MDHGGGFQFGFLGKISEEIFLSFGAGIVAGILVSLYLKYIQTDPVLFILAFSYLISEAAKNFHLDTLIICITAGFWVTNASNRGKALIEMIEKIALLIYVVFFCLTGASLNLAALSSALFITIFLVAARMVFLYLSTSIGLRVSGESIRSPNTLWMAFLPQAGVSLGLITILQLENIQWGENLKTIVVAVIAVNQIIGPITLKYALQQSEDIKPEEQQSSANSQTIPT